MVPEFDEIIFKNRNQTYGAYKLRKFYKSVLSLSILGGVTAGIVLVTALSFKPEKIIAGGHKGIVVIIQPSALIPKVEKPEVAKMPARTQNVKNLKPEVTEDTNALAVTLATASDILISIGNQLPDDSLNDAMVDPDPVVPVETAPRVWVEEMPEFPGGVSALLQYIASNVIYPDDAIKNNIQGKVFIKFVVTPDGSADNVEVSKSVDPLLDNEAIRVIKSLPKFRPGKQGGIPVPVWYSIPVNFKIENR